MIDREYPNNPVIISEHMFFTLLSNLRQAAMLLDPPEDFKSWKYPEPNEAANHLMMIHSRLMDEGRRSI